MKKLIGTSLFLAFLLLTGFADASTCKCPRYCAFTTTEQRVFANPHSGWVVMPVESQPICNSPRG
jgi:hypothetical protein